MKFRFALVLIGLLLANSPSAQARRFDFSSETFASYFGGSYGPSRVFGTHFAKANPAGVETDREVMANASGEFGVVISGQNFALRLGAEYLMPKHISDIRGNNASKQEMFILDSQLTAFTPTVNLEMQLYQQPTSRMFVGGGGGISFVTLDNKYKMTTDGTAQLGVADYNEQASGKAQIYQAYVGYEFLFTDTVTLTLGLGYRWGLITGLKSETEVTTMQGQVRVGDELKNIDGGVRKVDVGGGYGSINMRFYYF